MKNMSIAYKNFFKQIDAKAFEKMQGYDPNTLEKLENDERQEVEDKIIYLYKSGDIQVEAFLPKLIYYDGINLLKESLNDFKSPSSRNADIAFLLWSQTKEKKYKDMLIEDFNINNRYAQQMILNYILHLPADDQLRKFYIEICISNMHEMLRYTAGKGLLYCINIIDDAINFKVTAEIRDILKSVTEGDIETRKINIRSLISI